MVSMRQFDINLFTKVIVEQKLKPEALQWLSYFS